MIPAHDSPLAALTFNASATKLASASERVRNTFEDTQNQTCLLCFLTIRTLLRLICVFNAAVQKILVSVLW